MPSVWGKCNKRSPMLQQCQVLSCCEAGGSNNCFSIAICWLYRRLGFNVLLMSLQFAINVMETCVNAHIRVPLSAELSKCLRAFFCLIGLTPLIILVGMRIRKGPHGIPDQKMPITSPVFPTLFFFAGKRLPSVSQDGKSWSKTFM